MEEFKYLGSTAGLQSNGKCSSEVKKRVPAGWNGWRRATGDMRQKDIRWNETKNVQCVGKTSCDVMIGDCSINKNTENRAGNR